jgi:CDP-diacylglycerol--glycerol-3-phosphate 3-phosphatidyltransferase
MELGGFYNSVLALIVFCIASITDFFDGQIARRNKIVTPLGIFLDPLADKLLVLSAFICFVKIPALRIEPWVVIAIIAREFLITALRSIAASKNIVIPADKSGKIKTTFQIIVIVFIMIILILNEASFKFSNITPNIFKFYDTKYYFVGHAIMAKIPFWASLIVVIVTIFSGVKYMCKYRKLICE